MRRLHTAALAAFLLCTCAGAARAYYFTDCTFSLVTQGGIAVLDTSKQFVPGEVGNCGGGSVGCCVKIVSQLDKSTDGGATWVGVKHQEDTFTYGCNTSNNNPTAFVQAATGLYRCTSNLQTCAGTVLHNFGTNTHTFP